MSWDKGFNFRSTSGFVTDGTNETYVLLTDVYPTTRNGVTFGGDTFPFDVVDRNASLDRRLAGIHYHMNDGSAQSLFRVDLPSATDYEIRLALGDTASQGYHYAQVRDDTSALFTVIDTNGTAADRWDDSTGTEWTDATWPGSNVATIGSFSSTIFWLAYGTPDAQSASTCVSHIFISQADPSAAQPTRSRKLATQQRMVV